MTRQSQVKLRAILSHEAEWADYEFTLTIQRLHQRFDNPVRFWSAQRIVEAIEAIHGAIADFGRFAREQFERGPCSPSHVQIACDAVESFWDQLQSWVPIIIWPPDGKPLAGYEEIEVEAQVDITRVRLSIDGLLDQLRQRGLNKPRMTNAVANDWGNLAEPPLGKVPTWLNMFQAAAWVVFRTDRAMVMLDRSSLLHCEIRFSDVEQIGSLDEFEVALRAGRPVAEGSHGNSGEIAPVPQSAWTSMSAAPLHPDNDAFYRDIAMRRDILVSAFPKRETLATRERRSKPKLPSAQLHAWFGRLGKRQQQAQSTLYLRAVDDFPESRVTHADIRALTPGRPRGRKTKF